MSELLKLAERCEAAGGPSFDLDKAILAGLGFTWRGMDYWSRDSMWKGPIHFTHKIDDAIALIPKNFSFELCRSDAPASSDKLKFTRCWVWDWRRGPLAIDPDNEWKAEGNRPLPLNICAAALRARDHVSGSGERGNG